MTALNPVDDKLPEEKLGSYLKRAREARGLSAAELANLTRLSAKNIELIENDEWNAFQVEAYLRGYLNSICYKLGLDNRKVLGWYNESRGSANPFEDDTSSAKNYKVTPVEKVGTKSHSKALFFAIAVLVVAFVVVSHFFGNLKEAEQVETPVKTEATEETVAEELPEMPEGAEVVPVDSIQDSLHVESSSTESTNTLSQAQVEEAVKKSELPASATIFITSSSAKIEKEEVKPVANKGKTRVELTASGEMRSWVGMKRNESDDNFLKEANLSKAGTKMVYNANDTLYVIIGEPRAISKMTLNGVETPLPEMKFGRVTRFYVYNGRIVGGAR